jgi:hypothetical protein
MTKSRRAKPNLTQKVVRGIIRDFINQVNGKVDEVTITSPVKGSEFWYRDRLASQLNGQIEVSTKAGRIDILTDVEIIEVKRVSKWKEAIGQVKSYRQYYPNHGMRVHLFGKLTNSKLNVIQKVCQAEGIYLSWE